jgi:hypothetical protein
MHITFPDDDFDCPGELDDVLQRIPVGNEPGHWPNRPEEIQILQRLAGGRSGSEVLEAVVKHGSHEARKVIKIGPIHELQNEFQSFVTHLKNASALFVRIEAATPGVLCGVSAGGVEREAVVYDHASRFQGKPRSKARTFEDLAREAVSRGGRLSHRLSPPWRYYFKACAMTFMREAKSSKMRPPCKNRGTAAWESTRW